MGDVKMTIHNFFKIRKFKFTDGHSVFRLEDDKTVDVFENDEIIILQEADHMNDYHWVFLYKGEICYQYNYSIEDKIEEI
jgi:hypothetical protein